MTAAPETPRVAPPALERWGVYIAGPGLEGWLLMRGIQRAHGGPLEPFVFDDEELARVWAAKLQPLRPHHSVCARPYFEGDEAVGQYSADPG